MNKLLLAGILGLGLSFSASAALAGPVAESVKAAMGEARENLVALLGTTDKDGQAKRVEAIKAASAKVDAAVAKHGDALKVFGAVWSEFKTTRDTQIIPLIKEGKVVEAKALATGVQAERVKKMGEILGSMAQ
ncbi:MAG: hypothetical protein HQL65_09210 [Magnetococcales bacterium]|nr:hypothetical protein [Magnetococcales bacterium]